MRRFATLTALTALILAGAAAAQSPRRPTAWPAIPVAPPPPPPPPAAYPVSGPYNVFFNAGTAIMTPDAEMVLIELVSQAKRAPGSSTATVAGNCDQAEAASGFCDRVAGERAANVAAKFKALGLPARYRITVRNDGPNRPKIEVPPGTSEAMNRYVSISFMGPQM